MKICDQVNTRKEGTGKQKIEILVKMRGAVFFFYVGWILVTFNGVLT